MSIFDAGDLSLNISNKLERAGLFSCKNIIELSDFELRMKTSLNTEECLRVQELASKSILKTSFLPINEVPSLNNAKRITLDCNLLDKLLGGGIPMRGITELYGESGAGKTQICLQVSLTVQYPTSRGGLAAGAVYICTEDKFPTNRLNQMLQHFPRDSNVKVEMKNAKFGDKIYVDHIGDVDGLKECIFYRLPRLLENCQVGIIIVDSIAAIYRAEYTFKQSIERAKNIRDIALQLHRISRKFNVAILCINQVSDALERNTEKLPALGLVWANMVTTRLQAFRYPKRALKVVSAPDLPSEFCYYTISDGGVFGSETPPD